MSPLKSLKLANQRMVSLTDDFDRRRIWPDKRNWEKIYLAEQ